MGRRGAAARRINLLQVVELLQTHITPAPCQAVFGRVRRTERQRRSMLISLWRRPAEPGVEIRDLAVYEALLAAGAGRSGTGLETTTQTQVAAGDGSPLGVPHGGALGLAQRRPRLVLEGPLLGRDAEVAGNDDPR